MKIEFRQGIVRYPAIGGVQQFLQRNPGTGNITLNPGNGLIELAFAYKNTNYIFNEIEIFVDAWTGFVGGTDYWIYWDLNSRTAVRTFGSTLLAPIVSSSAPPSPAADQHWFDTTSNTMKVFQNGGFATVLRVFAAKYQGAITFVSMSNGGVPNFPFAGTQVGLNRSAFAGRILFEDNSLPILRSDRSFLTTEDQFFVDGSLVNNIRLESNVVSAEAQENLGAYQVVRYSDFNKIVLAGYNDVGQDEVIAITTEGALTGETTPLVVQGVVTNLSWNWSEAGVRLYVLENGLLVDVDPNISDPGTYPDKHVAIARVLSPQEIIFEQGLGGKGDQGDPGPAGVSPPASTISAGTVFITTPPTQSQLPTVVSDTDPRLSDARTPLPHTHAAMDISVTPFLNLTSNNSQDAFQELEEGKLDLEFGGQMQDFISLHANPTLPFHAVTKQYVDALTGNIASKALFLSPISFPNLISDSLQVPPIVPVIGDAYIVQTPGGGAWTGLSGNVVEWDGLVWQDRGTLVAHVRNNQIRMGIAFTSATVPGGSFRPGGVSKRGQIAIFDSNGNLVPDINGDYQIPLENQQVLIASVDPQSYTSLEEFNTYAFDGPWASNDNKWSPVAPGVSRNGNWVLTNSAGAGITPGLNLTLAAGAVLNVDQFSIGGTIDAATLQGSTPLTLAGDSLFYTGSPGGQFNVVATNYQNTALFGADANFNQFNQSSTNLQDALKDIFDRKASVSPAYTNFAAFPASPPEGMSALDVATGILYYRYSGSWVALPSLSQVTDIPYDISFFSPGPQLPTTIVGSFVSPRNVFIPAGSPTTYAYAISDGLLAGPSDMLYDIKLNGVNVGSVVFQGPGTQVGIVNFPLEVDLTPGDILSMHTQIPVDSTLTDVSVTIIGCASTQPGPCSTVLGVGIP